MKDFESIYDKISLKFKEKVDYVTSEYKLAKKSAFNKAKYVLILGIIILVIAHYFYNDAPLFIIFLLTLVATLIAYGIFLGKITKSSPTLDGSILEEIYDAVLKELPVEAKYIKDRGFDELVYSLGDFGSYDHFLSNTSIEGRLKNGTSFKISHATVSEGSGEDERVTFNGYITDIDLNKNFDEKFRIDHNGVIPVEDGNDIKLNVGKSLVNSISKILEKYKNDNQTRVCVTIINDKLLITIKSNYFEQLSISDPLDREKLELFYNNFYKIFNLLEEIVNKIKE